MKMLKRWISSYLERTVRYFFTKKVLFLWNSDLQNQNRRFEHVIAVTKMNQNHRNKKIFSLNKFNGRTHWTVCGWKHQIRIEKTGWRVKNYFPHHRPNDIHFIESRRREFKLYSIKHLTLCVFLHQRIWLNIFLLTVYLVIDNFVVISVWS